MRYLFLPWMLLIMSGCVTHLTDAGRRVKLVEGRDPAKVNKCTKLGVVVGNPDSVLSNREYGILFATKDARNKAGLIPSADTLLITNDESRWLGGEVAGIVYNCSGPRAEQHQSALSAGVKADDKAGKIDRALFDKAKKCQVAGGVWVNDACVTRME
jgi:hypothetical protein